MYWVGVLISWAMPPASWPRASICWARRRSSARRRLSVTSSTVATRVREPPSLSWTTTSLTWTTRAVPSGRRAWGVDGLGGYVFGPGRRGPDDGVVEQVGTPAAL